MVLKEGARVKAGVGAISTRSDEPVKFVSPVKAPFQKY
jgi:hypothetical protein